MIFLDRDGTINELGTGYIIDPDRLELIPGSAEAIKIFNELEEPVFVVTNQSIVGRKMATHKTVRHLHYKMDQLLEEHDAFIDHYFYCFHSPETFCSCRKPEIGMFEQMKIQYSHQLYEDRFNLSQSFMVGDNSCDIEFGKACGMKTVLVKTGHGLSHINQCKPDYIFDNLHDFSVYFKENNHLNFQGS